VLKFQSRITSTCLCVYLHFNVNINKILYLKTNHLRCCLNIWPYKWLCVTLLVPTFLNVLECNKTKQTNVCLFGFSTDYLIHVSRQSDHRTAILGLFNFNVQEGCSPLPVQHSFLKISQLCVSFIFQIALILWDWSVKE